MQSSSKSLEIRLHKGVWMAIITPSHPQYTMIQQLENENVPPSWIAKRHVRDGKQNYHITIFNPQELVNNKSMRQNIKSLDKEIAFYPLGLYIDDEIAYLPVYFPWGEKIRQEVGIYPKEYVFKHFHITLGFVAKDKHDINKSIVTVSPEKLLSKSISTIQLTSEEVKYVDPIMFEFLYQHLNYLTNVVINYLSVISKNQYKLDQALRITEELMELDLIRGAFSWLKIIKMMRKTDDQQVTQLFQEKFKDISLVSHLTPDNESYLPRLLKGFNTYSLDRVEYVYHRGMIRRVKKPKNWSHVTPNLYGSAIINSEHLDFLESQNIGVIINLMEKASSSIKDKCSAKYYHFPIDDRKATDKDNFNHILDIISDAITSDMRVVVHCLGGIGRTNMVLAGYLIREQGKELHFGVEELKKHRKVIITEEQMKFLTEYQEKPYDSNLHKIKYRGKSNPKMLILVGLPGSGKSTFSQKLIEVLGSDAIRINQDDMGKKECQDIVSKNAKNKKLLIIDRCNLTYTDRKEWVDYLSGGNAWVIEFNTPIEECCYRVEHRGKHPTLSGKGGVKIVKAMAAKREGFEKEKEKLPQITNYISLQKEEEVNHLLQSWGMGKIIMPTSLFKFPRTRHLVNLGSASRDDLIVEKDIQKIFLHQKIYIEEKIDGANLGISIDEESMKILFQNRSHYVTTEYHHQFSKLGNWEKNHSHEIYTLLRPGRDILFGEWMYCQHSIHYTQLPDYFVAFDIYDRQERKFLSRKKLELLLGETTIPLIRCVTETQVKTLKEIEEYVTSSAKNKSQYYDGPLEGVYVRVCDENWTLHRGKIVRSDFICTNQHWAKNMFVYNKLKY